GAQNVIFCIESFLVAPSIVLRSVMGEESHQLRVSKQGEFMKILTVITLVSALCLTACGSRDKKKAEAEAAPQTAETPAVQTMSSEEVEQITASWSPRHRQIIPELTAKYGQPNESTSDMVIWNNNGPWLRTIVRRDDN